MKATGEIPTRRKAIAKWILAVVRSREGQLARVDGTRSAMPPQQHAISDVSLWLFLPYLGIVILVGAVALRIGVLPSPTPVGTYWTAAGIWGGWFAASLAFRRFCLATLPTVPAVEDGGALWQRMRNACGVAALILVPSAILLSYLIGLASGRA